MSPNLGRGCLGGEVEFENLAKDCHILSPTSQFLLSFLICFIQPPPLVKWKWISCVWLGNPMDYIAHQAPLSMEFSRQECLSGLLFPFPLIEPRSCEMQAEPHFTVWATLFLTCLPKLPQKKLVYGLKESQVTVSMRQLSMRFPIVTLIPHEICLTQTYTHSMSKSQTTFPPGQTWGWWGSPERAPFSRLSQMMSGWSTPWPI